MAISDRKNFHKPNGLSRSSAETFPNRPSSCLKWRMILPRRSAIVWRKSNSKRSSVELIFTRNRSQKKFQSGTENRRQKMICANGRRSEKTKLN